MNEMDKCNRCGKDMKGQIYTDGVGCYCKECAAWLRGNKWAKTKQSRKNKEVKNENL